MTGPQPVAFRTRVDGWLAAVLGGALVALAWGTATAFREEPAVGWMMLAAAASTVLLVAALSLPTEYVVDEHALVIRFGLFRKAIPLAAIERVYPTRNPLSAPAWSLDRLGVRYRTGRWSGLVLISPAEREVFLSLLAERAGMQRRGAALTRDAHP